jgi:hypothetical protein
MACILSLGVSQFVLLFNIQPRLAVDAQVLQAAREYNVPDFTRAFLGDFETLHQSIAPNIVENKETARKHQFARARQHHLKEGDLV